MQLLILVLLKHSRVIHSHSAERKFLFCFNRASLKKTKTLLNEESSILPAKIKNTDKTIPELQKHFEIFQHDDYDRRIDCFKSHQFCLKLQRSGIPALPNKSVLQSTSSKTSLLRLRGQQQDEKRLTVNQIQYSNSYIFSVLRIIKAF